MNLNFWNLFHVTFVKRLKKRNNFTKVDNTNLNSKNNNFYNYFSVISGEFLIQAKFFKQISRCKIKINIPTKVNPCFIKKSSSSLSLSW